jgi:hypothetical protein
MKIASCSAACTAHQARMLRSDRPPHAGVEFGMAALHVLEDRDSPQIK